MNLVAKAHDRYAAAVLLWLGEDGSSERQEYRSSTLRLASRGETILHMIACGATFATTRDKGTASKK
jgi:hypothetical protein